MPYASIWIHQSFKIFLKDLHSEHVTDGAVEIIFPSKEGILELPVCGAMQVPLFRHFVGFGSLEELPEFYPMMREWVDYMHRVDARNGETVFQISVFRLATDIRTVHR